MEYPLSRERRRAVLHAIADNPTLAAVFSSKNKDPELPLRPPPEPAKAPTPAPAWVALLAAWMGLVMLVASVVLIFLPGSTHPREELEHQVPYSMADKFLPIPIYGITVALFLGIVVLYQMRSEPRPLPDAMVNQRIQAWVGIVLALIGAIVIYTWVAMTGPKHV